MVAAPNYTLPITGIDPSRYEIRVAGETGGMLDTKLVHQAIDLMQSTYDDPSECMSREKVIKGLASAALDKKLRVNVLMDKQTNEPVGFTISEEYFDPMGKPKAACLTYANMKQDLARTPGAGALVAMLHDAAVAPISCPMIAEANPGDQAFLSKAIDKSKNPYDPMNNHDALATELWIKCGAIPPASPELLDILQKQAKGEAVDDARVKELLHCGDNLVVVDGKVKSAIVPVTYHALNLGDDFNPHDPFKGGPEDLHLIQVRLNGGLPNYQDVAMAYRMLNTEILEGKENPMKPEQIRDVMMQSPECLHTTQSCEKLAGMMQQIAQGAGQSAGAGGRRV